MVRKQRGNPRRKRNNSRNIIVFENDSKTKEEMINVILYVYVLGRNGEILDFDVNLLCLLGG